MERLVGREREESSLHSALHRARTGNGSLLLISGEAGIGKTMLVDSFLSTVRGQDQVLTLYGGCYDLTTTPPYGPWLDALQRGSLDKPLEKISALLDESRESRSHRTPERFLVEFITCLTQLAATQPLILVLEDMHWSDQASLELLRYASRHISRHPIVLIVTYRDDEITRDHPLFRLIPILVREAGAHRIELRRFNIAQLQAMVCQSYPVDPFDAERLARFLEHYVHGNPLFASELLRTLESDGILRSDESTWRLGDLETSSIPIFIQQIVEGRLARADDEAKTAMELMSVLGQSAAIGDLKRLESEFEISAALERAAATGLISLDSRNGSVGFRHAIVREVIYERISHTQRQRMHMRIAIELMERHTVAPDTVANHLVNAGDERGIEWLIKAGEQAEAQFAWHEAIERYILAASEIECRSGEQWKIACLMLRAGNLLRFADPGRSSRYLEHSLRAAQASDREDIRIRVLFGIGQNKCNLGLPVEGLAMMKEAIERAEKLPEDAFTSRPALLTVLDPAEERPLLWFRGNLVYWLAAHGRPRDALEFGEQILDFDWRAASDERRFDEIAAMSPPGSRTAYIGLGQALGLLGSPHESSLAFRLALEVNRGSRFAPHNVMVANNALLGCYLPYLANDESERRTQAATIDDWLDLSEGMVSEPFLSGYEPLLLWEGRWQELRKLIERNPEPTLFPYWSTAFVTRAELMRLSGEFTTARHFLNKLLPDGPRENPERHVHTLPGEAHRVAARLALDEDDSDRAREWLIAHDKWLGWIGAVPGRAAGRLCWAEIAQAEDDMHSAYQQACLALELASDPVQPLVLMQVHRFLGELELKHGAIGPAETHLTRALELSAKCRAKYEHARTQLALADLLLQANDAKSSRKLLVKARSTLHELRARPALQRSEGLAQMVANAMEPDEYGLSPREKEVLSLIVEGLTDRRIAERLYISHRTVMRHVTSILRKLSVDSRTAAAAKAVSERIR